MMKKIIMMLIAFSSIVVTTRSEALGEREQFLRGNKLYAQGAYKEALTEYQALASKGGAVWYNMGNCSYHLGAFLDAAVYYLRALPLLAAHERRDAYTNIDLVYEKLGKAAPVGPSWWSTLVWRIQTTHYKWWQLLFLLGWFLLFGMLLCRVKFYNKALVMLIIALFTLCAGGAMIVKYYAQLQVHAVVKDKEVALYAGPDSKFHAVGMVDEGDYVRVVATRGQWCHVMHQAHSGWVTVQSVIPIEKTTLGE